MVQFRNSERLADALCREVGQFEAKVAGLEKKCGQIRGRITELSEKLQHLRDSFDHISGGGHASLEGLSPARIAEICGISDHMEKSLPKSVPEACSDFIVHEPDDRIIFIDGHLSGCRLHGVQLMEMIKSRFQTLASMPEPCGERADALRILYVPEWPEPSVDLESAERRVVVASPADLISILGTVALRWLTFMCGQGARAVVDQGQDLVDVMSAFISDFTEAEKVLCELVNDCALASRRRQEAGAPLRA